ncbi:hypothetical protein [Streptomyces sp. MS191]|uniref:hypothetical protein n=1 Tax=Streptomyces sp. ms191 TaxID=1827978 RepID=UPI0011CE9202|nr:hypothetical protein [Streptomyces sp. ms191]
MEWGTIVTVLLGGLIGLSGETVGRMGARRQAQIARQEALEDASKARSQAIEDDSRRGKEARERTAVENILSAYLENPIRLVDQPSEETVLSVTKICLVLGFEQSFILNAELRQRVAEICYFLDISTDGDVCGYSAAEVGFLSRSEMRMLMGAWARGEDLPNSIEGWGELRRGLAEIERNWQQKLRDSGLRVEVPPLSIY